ncbi:hypothetical protein [Rickettsia endosymbiont of Pantilius tunicatus]|uniref:hypothetical protein n=1 Tax=Rickettsia endosymbiont of Pantilius tunicatus TaxID=3066267 RepID=UPI0030E19FDF
MSRLIITSSDNKSNDGLGPITINDFQYTFTFKSAFIPGNNITIINDNSKGSSLSRTKIFYNDGSNDVNIETNNKGIICNNFAEKFKVETKEVTIPADGFKITYNNNQDLNYTRISYDNGIIIQIKAGIVSIWNKGWKDWVEFRDYCSVTQITLKSEITISNQENLHELIIQKETWIKNKPIILNNYCSHLEDISINADTIFNNFCTHSKANFINIAHGTGFEQTGNDLAINKLRLDLAAKIQFTHDGSNYRFCNPPITNTNLVIRNLHGFVEKAKSFTDEYCCENWLGYDYDLIKSFILQNEECLGIPPLGSVEHIE